MLVENINLTHRVRRLFFCECKARVKENARPLIFIIGLFTKKYLTDA
ncbi:hypothetical protein BSPWISOX_2823 [uncultured Gammaproteobacteria bacterium]|nr:hypothetical protein BSPWISOX_2823 [uncultured Gammaproteobacteria bacterium]